MTLRSVIADPPARSDVIPNPVISFAVIVLAPVVFWTLVVSLAAGGLGYTLPTSVLAGIALGIGCFLGVIWALVLIGGHDGGR